MTKTTIAAKVHETLDAHRHFTTKIAFNGELADVVAQALHFGFRQVFHLGGTVNPSSVTNLLRARTADTVDRGQRDFGMLVVGNVPIMYLLNKDWYHTLMYTVVGQIILAVCAAAIFISTAFVIRLTKPIEYRR